MTMTTTRTLTAGQPVATNLIQTGDRFQVIGGPHTGYVVTARTSRASDIRDSLINDPTPGWDIEGPATLNGSPAGDLHYGGVIRHVIYLGAADRAPFRVSDLLSMPYAKPSPFLSPKPGAGTRFMLANGTTATVLAATVGQQNEPCDMYANELSVTVTVEGRTGGYSVEGLRHLFGARRACLDRMFQGRAVVNLVLPGDTPLAITDAMKHTCDAKPAQPCIDDIVCTAAGRDPVNLYPSATTTIEPRTDEGATFTEDGRGNWHPVEGMTGAGLAAIAAGTGTANDPPLPAPRDGGREMHSGVLRITDSPSYKPERCCFGTECWAAWLVYNGEDDEDGYGADHQPYAVCARHLAEACTRKTEPGSAQPAQVIDETDD